MGGYRGVGLALVLIAGGCSTPQHERDLAKNRVLYRSPGFQAPSKKHYHAYLAPLQDLRTAPPQPQGAVVAEFMREGYWQRSVRAMVEEILRTELQKSHIYAGLAATPADTNLIIEPSLVALYGAWEYRAGGTASYGSRSYAVTALKIKVYGPADASGKRRVWMDKEFREFVGSDFMLATPPNIPQLTGVALSRTMARVLEAVYAADGRKVREATATQKTTQKTDK